MIGVNFAGHLDFVDGDLPGSTVEGAPFAGSLVIESGQTAGAGSLDNGIMAAAFYDFSGSSAELTVSMPGLFLSSSAGASDLQIRLRDDLVINENTFEIAAPGDPDAVWWDELFIESANNIAGGPAPYEMRILAEVLIPYPVNPHPTLIEGGGLPQSPEELGALLLGKEFWVSWDALTLTGVTGTIETVYPIPEPSAGALVLLGLGVVAASRRVTRR